MPFFLDQTANMKMVESAGAGKLIRWNELSTELLLSTIQAILSDKKYGLVLI